MPDRAKKTTTTRAAQHSQGAEQRAQREIAAVLAPRAVRTGPALFSPADVMAMQRTVGNQAVGMMIDRGSQAQPLLLQTNVRAPASRLAAQATVAPATTHSSGAAFLSRSTVIQRGSILNLEGIPDDVEQKADKQNLVNELKNAIAEDIPKDLIISVFRYVSNTKLSSLPEEGRGIWDDYLRAIEVMGEGKFNRWLGIAGDAVLDIPGFKMLLTDKQAQSADQKAETILEEFDPPPSFAGKTYDQIVSILKGLRYIQLEKHSETSGDEPAYGQDVWCNDEHMVVRIKVGGRSINGRYPRPPHVVKEITETPFLYRPEDIICKLTDDNVKIPAGTKYSARDMQAWYEKTKKVKLDNNAWKNPNGFRDANQGNSDYANFADLHHEWAEGAHTSIGGTPNVPLVRPSEVGKYRSIYEKYNDKIVTGRMEKYGIDASIEDDDERQYLQLDEYLLWKDAKYRLGIRD